MSEQAFFGSELRRRRTEAQLSLADLAKIVHYSKSHLSKVETGVKLPGPDLAQRCDAALDAEGALAGLVGGRVRRAAATGEPFAGEELVMSLRSDGPSEVDMIRRRELLASGVAVAVAWMLDPAPSPGRYSEEVLESFRSMFAELRRLGQRVSPSTLAPIVIAHAHALQSVAVVAGAAIRDEMLVLAAHFATYAGWMAQESGDARAADLWTDRAAGLAAAAGDAELVAYSYVRRALGALNEHDPLRTIALAQRAQATTTSPRVMGLAAQREAQGHAIAGDSRACGAALDRAARLLSGSVGSGSAPVIGTSTVEDPAAITEGWCLYDLGRSDRAVAILQRELPRIPPGALRTRARYGARLALAQASLREIEQACATIEPVLDIVAHTNSATIRVDLRHLARTLNRWPGEPAVRAIQPALAAALHRHVSVGEARTRPRGTA